MQARAIPSAGADRVRSGSLRCPNQTRDSAVMEAASWSRYTTRRRRSLAGAVLGGGTRPAWRAGTSRTGGAATSQARLPALPAARTPCAVRDSSPRRAPADRRSTARRRCAILTTLVIARRAQPAVAIHSEAPEACSYGSPRTPRVLAMTIEGTEVHQEEAAGRRGNPRGAATRSCGSIGHCRTTGALRLLTITGGT